LVIGKQGVIAAAEFQIFFKVFFFHGLFALLADSQR
jgi:hypothetical protein